MAKLCDLLANKKVYKALNDRLNVMNLIYSNFNESNSNVFSFFTESFENLIYMRETNVDISLTEDVILFMKKINRCIDCYIFEMDSDISTFSLIEYFFGNDSELFPNINTINVILDLEEFVIIKGCDKRIVIPIDIDEPIYGNLDCVTIFKDGIEYIICKIELVNYF